MSTPAPAGVPKRVRVTSPRRDARPRAERRPRAQDLTEQTGLGEVYLAALLRAQLRLALAVLLVVAAVLGGLPLLFLTVPQVRDAHVGPVPLPWLVVGALLYPLIVLVARAYVRGAERIEREFADLMRAR